MQTQIQYPEAHFLLSSTRKKMPSMNQPVIDTRKKRRRSKKKATKLIQKDVDDEADEDCYENSLYARRNSLMTTPRTNQSTKSVKRRSSIHASPSNNSLSTRDRICAFFHRQPTTPPTQQHHPRTACGFFARKRKSEPKCSDRTAELLVSYALRKSLVLND